MSVAVTFLKGVKGARARQLRELGVETVDDLVRLAPRYYEDRTRVVGGAELTGGAAVTLIVRIIRVNFRQID
ncbi:MAG: hypothetical protein J6X19_06465, partial [Clostridia bacterium]|nr:hypothetical protein [Clostridia bacterium]